MDDVSREIMMMELDEVSNGVSARELMGLTLGDCMWAICHSEQLRQQVSRFRQKNFTK